MRASRPGYRIDERPNPTRPTTHPDEGAPMTQHTTITAPAGMLTQLGLADPA